MSYAEWEMLLLCAFQQNLNPNHSKGAKDLFQNNDVKPATVGEANSFRKSAENCKEVSLQTKNSCGCWRTKLFQ